MLNDSVPRDPDRRRTPRFSLPIGRVSGSQGEVRLLNLSRQGMAIEMPGVMPLSRGDSQSFTLQHLHHSVEVRGRVRWVRLDRREDAGPGRVQSIQVVGVTFEEILTREPPGIWNHLEPPAPEPEEEEPKEPERPAAAGRPEPPSLLEPRDGATLVDSEVTVICRIDGPAEVTAIDINGVGGTLEGDRAVAQVALDPGVSRLTALIRWKNGSYRTYSLGRVTRKE